LKKETTEKPPLHIWAPDIFGSIGGLQKHLYFIWLAIKDLVAGSRIKIISKSNSTKIVFALRLLWSSLVNKPGLIIVGHVNFSPLAYLTKRLAKIPFWVVTYGIEAWGIRNNFVKKSLFASDRILSMSSFTKNMLTREQNIPADKISVLPGSFDPGLFSIKAKPSYLLKKYGLSEKQPVILTVCRLEKAEQYKGYDRVIEAMPGLIQTFPDIRYILVGEGNDTERIKELIHRLGLDKYITLPGIFVGEELCDHYNLCDCFAMPSTGEGFGIVFLEALACGKPVLAGNQDGSVDALRNGELGVLVDPNDINQISQNLIQVLRHEHPNKIIYNPQLLREKTIEYFGFDKFKSTLRNILN